MSKGGAAQPAAADPAALAQSQTSSNISTAQAQAALNNINTYSPYGSSVYTPTTDASGQTTYSLNQTLSPQLQNLFGSQTSLAQILAGAGTGVAQGAPGLTSAGQNLLTGPVLNAAGAVPTNLDLSGVAPITQLTPGSFRTDVAQGPVQGSVGANFPSLVKQAQDAAYQAQTQYLDPQFKQSESDLRQRLADQGIAEGSPAFTRAIGDFTRQKQQAYDSAQNQAVAAGNQQEQSLFGQSLSAGTFANQAQQQLFGQGLSLADLYNQSVLGAAGQQNTAAGLGLQRAQAVAGQPENALQSLLAAGSNIYGTGISGLGAGGQMVNLAPTWPISIPTMGGSPSTVTPANIGTLTQAATNQNQLANQSLMNNLGSLGRAVQMGSSGSGLFGGGGVLGLGGLFGGGGAVAPSALGIMGLPAGTGMSAFTDAVMAAAL